MVSQAQKWRDQLSIAGQPLRTPAAQQRSGTARTARQDGAPARARPGSDIDAVIKPAIRHPLHRRGCFLHDDGDGIAFDRLA